MPRKAKKSVVSPHKRAPRLSKGAVPPSSTPVVDPAPSSLPPDLSPAVIAELSLAVRKKADRWSNLPTTSPIRAKVFQIVALKIQGNSTEEISKIVGIKAATVRQYLWIAGKNGWLSVADPQDDVDYNLAHRAVSNLDELLHARDRVSGLPDKEITLQTLRGTGIFRNHDARPADSPVGQQNILQITIQAPPTGPLPQVRVGAMQGAPAFIEGEKID